MYGIWTLFVVVLFFVLTPGVVVSLPQGGTVQQKAMVHALVFGILFHLGYKVFWNYYYE
jgi:hypothetical protein